MRAGHGDATTGEKSGGFGLAPSNRITAECTSWAWRFSLAPLPANGANLGEWSALRFASFAGNNPAKWE
jgi:hypothetical protein